MKRFLFLLLLASWGLPSTRAEEAKKADPVEEAGTNNLPPDPFVEIESIQKASDFTRKVDRTRGTFTLDAKDGTYTPGSHFANWSWSMKAERWGNFYAGLIYDSLRPKLGVQLKIGEAAVLKSYAPRISLLPENGRLRGESAHW